MARYGMVVAGNMMEDCKRVPAEGKGALLAEIVQVQPTSDVVTLYNRNATAYGASPTDVTTGAAILSRIKHALHIGISAMMVTGAPTTTTAIRVPVVKYINGPTTVATIYAKGIAQAGGSGVSIVVFGKDF